MRWVEALHPEWIACEQVPPALPVWRQFATHFETLGYNVWCGVLNAANYGVPQTRKRAFLIASRTHQVQPPEPTHAKNPEPSLFGQLEPWVTMADALGWGRTKPAWTLAGGTGAGGADQMMQGGSGARKQTADEIANGEWVLNPGISSGHNHKRFYRTQEPAPTLAFGHDSAGWKWETLWPMERPSTTVMGIDRVAHPKHRGEGESQFPVGRTFTTQQCANGEVDNDGPITIRLTPQDALLLQSFPHDYPIQGPKTKQFEQIGNAVPPQLAAHVLAAATGTTYTGDNTND